MLKHGCKKRLHARADIANAHPALLKDHQHVLVIKSCSTTSSTLLQTILHLVSVISRNMHFSLSPLTFAAVTFMLTSPTTCLNIPSIFQFTQTEAANTTTEVDSPSSNQTISAPPLHVPICGRSRGDWTLLTCARLLVNLKNLPDYTKEAIWSKFVTGESHLPTTFSLTDAASQKTCYLTFDLYNAAAQITASERFSLQEEQTDLNRIYYACLKPRSVYGIERIGTKGNVAALLGPRYADPVLSEELGGLFANGSASGNETVIDLTRYEDIVAD